MSQDDFSLSVTTETLLSLPIADALEESQEPKVRSYEQVFFERATEAEQGGSPECATAWHLLSQVSRFLMKASDPNNPFRPQSEGVNGRSLLPSDLDETSARAIHALAEKVDDDELCARLFDVTWCRLRDPKAARSAVQCYIDAADRLFDPKGWTPYMERAERALRLASQLSDEKLVEAILTRLERRIVELDGTDPLFLTSRLMELVDEYEAGDPEVMSRIASKAADSATKSKDFRRARAHLENLVRLRRRASDKDGELQARVAIAETYVGEAEKKSDEGVALAAAVFFEQAHEAYRNIPGMGDTAAKVYARLRKAQRDARNSLETFTTPGVDLTPMIKAARELVAGKSFGEALLAVALCMRPTNFDREAKTARDMISQFPLQNLVGGMKIDDDGRVVARRTATVISDADKAEQAVWERIVEQVVLRYQFDVKGRILPAVNQLNFEHSLSLRDFRDLVVNNPFVPPGHEDLFAKGFHAGIQWNFPEALSILVPQMENSVRYLLASDGVEVTRRDKHGLQTMTQLGAVLSDPKGELQAIVGADIIKELKLLFTDQHGPDLRNRIAHGLMSHEEYFSTCAIYAWWFILHVTMNPVCRRFAPES